MMMQVANFVWIKGCGYYAPGQTEAGALADMRRELDALEARFPGLKAEIKSEDRAACLLSKRVVGARLDCAFPFVLQATDDR